MQKFQRNYRLTVAVDDKGTQVQISYPLTLEFSVRRANLSNAGTATFRIYNLNEKNRNQIFRGYTDIGIMRVIKLEAGYGNDVNSLSTIFNGNISQALSSRAEGQVNYITEIEAFDFAFAMQNSRSGWTEAPGVKKDDVVRRLVSNIQYPTNGVNTSLPVGYISSYGNEVYSRGFKASGNTWDILKRETDGQCTIDLGKIFIIKKNEAFVGGITKINSDSGLLGTPRQVKNWVTFDMLFEPGLLVNQIVTLDSRSNTRMNGTYKVIGLEHTGTISGAFGGKCKTKVTLLVGDKNKSTSFDTVVAK